MIILFYFTYILYFYEYLIGKAFVIFKYAEDMHVIPKKYEYERKQLYIL